MNKKKSLSELRFDVEKGAQRKKYYENEIKIKKHQIKHLTRTERTHKTLQSRRDAGEVH